MHILLQSAFATKFFNLVNNLHSDPFREDDSRLATTQGLPCTSCCHPRGWCLGTSSRYVIKSNWIHIRTHTAVQELTTPAACIWASAGYSVHVRDPSADQRAACVTYVKENVATYAVHTEAEPGEITAYEDLEQALRNAWLVIEAVPEKIQLKIDTFEQLDKLAPSDCILASNSSSYKSSEMLGKVSDSAKSRILNMHYYMPPQVMVVELMTDGFTNKSIFPFMVERSKEAGTKPYVARKESTGFIFNRLWAAVKRESLTILAEEVSTPNEIDSIWTEIFVKGGMVPCKGMDSM